MQSTRSFGPLLGLALVSIAAGQQRAIPAAPPLMACGTHGNIEILCGTRQPEDLELAPDGKYLIATQFLNQGRGSSSGGGMALFDLAKKTFSRMAQMSEPDKSWGDPACPGSIGDALVSHGESLAKRKNGVWELYVVNHGGRESIEMFELKPVSGSWALVWHGCVAGSHDFNDLAILPDGGFVGTYPTALGSRENNGAAFGGGVTGYVARWTPGEGLSEVMGTRVAYPNGVVVSADGRQMYLNVFAAREVRKYELDGNNASQVGAVKVEFMPDNPKNGRWSFRLREKMAHTVQDERRESPNRGSPGR